MDIIEFPVTLDQSDLDRFVKGLNAFANELSPTSEKTGNVVKAHLFVAMSDHFDQQEVTVAADESLMGRISQDLKGWVHQLNQVADQTQKIAKVYLEIKISLENPDKIRQFAVLTADETGKLDWVMQEAPKIKKRDLEIKFTVKGEELYTKQTSFEELQEEISQLKDPKWIFAKMVIKGCAMTEHCHLKDARKWSYVISK